MVRLEALDEAEAASLRRMDCPVFETQPWVSGPPLSERRVAIITTAGLHRRDDSPFTIQSATS
ncbi:MAG: hypothetical protein BZY83_03250, partial [SAR202 cluster bacterium Casp-Chloro-G2]